jgi:hypothetical protein
VILSNKYHNYYYKMAYYERVNPAIIEPPVEAPAEQLAIVKQVREELSKTEGDKYADVIDMVLFRFSRKNGFDVQKTTKAFLHYMKWRNDKNVDKILESEFPKSDIIKQIVPYRYAGYDKAGRPLYIEKTGKLAVAAVTDTRVLTVDEFLQSHIWGMEYMASLAYKMSLTLGKRVDTVCSIIDLDGLGLHHRNAITVLKSAMDFDSLYYPERLGKIYVINAPWIAPSLYKLVHVFLDEYTKSCVQVVPIADTKTFLPTVIPIDNLPKQYGGTTPDIIISDTSSLVAAAASVDDGLTKQYVSYDHEVVLEGNENSVFTWFFRSEGDYDIDFSVTAVNADASRVAVKEVSRCVTSKGSYTSMKKCKLVIRWDNNFSYLYGKNLRYHCDVNSLMDNLTLKDSQESASVADEAAAKK